jgi:predicted Zn-dependent peptidase
VVERGLASAVSGAVLPTADPFLYTIAFTAARGVALEAVEQAALVEIERVRTGGVTPAEIARAQRQLKARLVFETDSVTNIAHQLGYFETVAGPGAFADVHRRIQLVTAEQVFEVAKRRLAASQRTVGWFRPVEARV